MCKPNSTHLKLCCFVIDFKVLVILACLNLHIVVGNKVISTSALALGIAALDWISSVSPSEELVLPSPMTSSPSTAVFVLVGYYP